MAQVLRANSPLAIVASHALGAGLLFLSAPIVARTLGPAGKGEAAATLAALMIAPFLLGLGLPLAVRRYAAIVDDDNEVMRSAFRLSLATMPMGLLAALALNATLLSEVSAQTQMWLAIGLTLTPVAILRDCFASVLVARRRFDRISVVGIVPAISTLVGVVVLAAAGLLDPSTVVAISVASTVIAAGVGWLFVRPVLRGPAFPMRELASMGLRSVGAQLGSVASLSADQVFLFSLMGPAQLGIYSVAATISQLPLPLARAYAASSFATIAREPQQTVATLAARYVDYAVITVGVVSLGAALVAPFAVPAIFGEAFSGAVAPLWILLVGTLAMSVVLVASSHLVAIGHGGLASVSLLIGLACGLASMWTLAPQHGAVGAALASALGYTVSAVLAVAFLRLKPHDFRQPNLARGAVRDLAGS